MVKRGILIIFLATVLVFTMLATSVFGVAPSSKTVDLKYDVNGSGKSDLLDVVILAQVASGYDVAYLPENADSNADGKINLMDVVFLSRVIAGWDMSKDYSQDSGNAYWPNISPNDVKAGTPIVTRKTSNSKSPMKDFVLMKSVNPTLPFSVKCYISGNEITALLPAGTKINSLKPEFSVNGDYVTYGGVKIISGETALDFTTPLTLTVHSGSRETQYKVYIMTLNTGIPSVAINTADFKSISSKTEYKACEVFAGGGSVLNGDYAFAENKTIQASGTVKGRGWTSWYYYPKKSYTLKFDKKQEMLGLPAHKEWVLAANFADRSLIRNAVAMELAHNVGSEAVMDVRFVDLWVNGVYAGNYQLIEKIEVSKDRVDITKFDETLAPEEIGYLVETNGHNKAVGEFGTWTNGQDADRPSLWRKLNENITLDPISGDMFFNSNYYNGIIFNINKPSDSKLIALENEKMQGYLDYIYKYMNDLEKAIKSRSYQKASQYLDMEAMAKWYIVEELAMNTDSKLHCSCYMYKDAGGTMKMGPVWDFDLGFGNGKYANQNNAYQTYLDGSRWFADLIAMPEFRSVVKEVWQQSKSKIDTLPSFINNTAKMLDKAQKVNFELWSITQPAEHTYWYTTEYVDNYNEQIDYLRKFTQDRIEYMNNKIMYQW